MCKMGEHIQRAMADGKKYEYQTSVEMQQKAEIEGLKEEINSNLDLYREMINKRDRERKRAENAEADRSRYRLALESLTVGGSEYANNPVRCVADIRAHEDSLSNTLNRFKKQRDEVLAELAEERTDHEMLKSAVNYFRPSRIVTNIMDIYDEIKSEAQDEKE